MKHLPILLLAALALLSSCGKKGTAKSTVQQFLTENLAKGEPDAFTIERLDSTNFLVDSVITQMHQTAEASPLYRNGITYAPRPSRQRLVWVTASFVSGGDSLRQTFYLTRDCDKVIAVKP